MDPILLENCLAFNLARSGVGHLTLVDPDKLEIENAYRHVLGQKYRGRLKAKALKQALEESLPFLRINSLEMFLDDALSSGQINLADFDLIISATGNPGAELQLNEILQSDHNDPSALYTWLEPLGIGGHAAFITNKDDK